MHPGVMRAVKPKAAACGSNNASMLTRSAVSPSSRQVEKAFNLGPVALDPVRPWIRAAHRHRIVKVPAHER
jgi:hypothetical protein